MSVMIDSLREELPSIGFEGDDRLGVEITGPDSESSFLEALPIIQRIVRRRRTSFQQADILDLTQGIALRLWKWRDKYRERSDRMSGEEWGSFAARTAYNEVNRHLTKTSTSTALSIEAANNIAEPSAEGETDLEVFSLIQAVWQDVCRLTLRQRRALLLHSQQLIVYFLQSGIDDLELARVLGLAIPEWNDIRSRLPLTDAQIAEVIQEGREQDRNPAANAKSIKKARYDARTKLKGVGRK